MEHTDFSNKTEFTHTKCMYENSDECLYTFNFLDSFKWKTH